MCLNVNGGAEHLCCDRQHMLWWRRVQSAMKSGGVALPEHTFSSQLRNYIIIFANHIIWLKSIVFKGSILSLCQLREPLKTNGTFKVVISSLCRTLLLRPLVRLSSPANVKLKTKRQKLSSHSSFTRGPVSLFVMHLQKNWRPVKLGQVVLRPQSLQETEAVMWPLPTLEKHSFACQN